MDAAISIRHLNHCFGAGPLRKQILFDISADIHAGEIVINTGPSGSGKTTMLTLVCGLRTVQDGSIRTLGVELNGATRDSLIDVRRNIGFIFQAHNLLGALSACENVEMGLLDEQLSRDAIRSRAEEMLRAVGLEHRIDHVPRQLSGGQKQRVAIARALVRRPKIVLADEPTAALDKASGREVVDLLHALAKQQGCAILLVTHDNRILDIADRILTLEDGRISSFAEGVRANTAQLLSGLERMHSSGDLRRHLRELSEPEFLKVVDGMTTEFEQLLHTLDVANAGATGALLDQVLDVAADRVRDKLSAERTTIFLVDGPREELWSKVAHHDGGRRLDIRLPIGTGIAGKVAQTGGTMNIADPYHHRDFNADVDRDSGFRTRSILTMPVTGRAGAVIGVVQVLNKRGAPAFTTADEQVLQHLVQPLGIVLETCSRIFRPGSNDATGAERRRRDDG